MPVSVKLYSLSTCSHCKTAKKLLEECGCPFDFVDVDRLEKEDRKTVLADLKNINPKRSFPTLVIGDKVIVGYREKEILDAVDHLSG
ncbi:MAG: glutaredoxin family protein [Proteobacteria bacterium]|nr:glutaredoxin family protein [Pseudomonadota bacterium]